MYIYFLNQKSLQNISHRNTWQVQDAAHSQGTRVRIEWAYLEPLIDGGKWWSFHWLLWTMPLQELGVPGLHCLHCSEPVELTLWANRVGQSICALPSGHWFITRHCQHFTVQPREGWGSFVERHAPSSFHIQVPCLRSLTAWITAWKDGRQQVAGVPLAGDFGECIRTLC